MAFNLDISSDFEQICSDFNNSATLRISGVDTTLPSVLSEPVEWKELDSTNAQVIRKGSLFVWSKSRSVQPPVGSIIIDEEGAYWTILKLTNKQHVETYEARCINVSIMPSVTNTAVILKATYGHGKSGEAKATWKGYVSGDVGGSAADEITARFQPLDESAKIEFSSEWSKQAYRIYLDPPGVPELAGGEYRIVDSEGHRFRVVRYYDEEKLDRVPLCHAVRITEGAEYGA